jgi:dihydrofolate reductase
MAYSIREAIDLCSPDEENFIIGGASVYRQFLPLACRLYLTVILKSFDADAFFPAVDFSRWKLLAREAFPGEGVNGIPYAYETWERIN